LLGHEQKLNKSHFYSNLIIQYNPKVLVNNFQYLVAKNIHIHFMVWNLSKNSAVTLCTIRVNM